MSEDLFVDLAYAEAQWPKGGFSPEMIKAHNIVA